MTALRLGVCVAAGPALLALACGSSGSPPKSGSAPTDAGSGGSGNGASVGGASQGGAATGGTANGGASGTANGGTSSGGTANGGTGASSGAGTGGAPSSGGTGSGGADGGGSASPSGPHLFFTDLVSGPNSGGENGNGAYVTLYGKGFGAAQGASTVTVGGGAVASYAIWTDTKITVELGSAAKTGNIVVNGAAGASNGLPFTVRAGSIYFVSSKSGSADDADGSFLHPWKTILHAKDSLQPGDIAYIGAAAGDSVSQTTESNYDAALSMEFSDGANSGTADAPKALIVYPGASATVGVESGLERGLLTPAITGTFDYWVVAGFSIRGEDEAIDLEGPTDGWRIVGNDLSCPNGTGETGCVTGMPTHLAFLGNTVHDAAANVADSAITKYYHGIYFGSSHIELGWNVVRDGKTCRAIQFHDTGGPNEFDIVVHDNLVHTTVCDGINFASVDPSQGAVRAFNNVVYDVGRGPDPSDGSSDYAGIYVANITNTGPAGSGNVELYDNTLYGCGSRGTSAAGAISLATGPVGIRMDDNLIVALAAETAFSGDTPSAGVSGSNNLIFGGGAAPAGLTATILSDPKFVNAANFDFHLSANSPAIDSGIRTPVATDFDGVPRPQGAAFDIGAFESVP